MILYSINIGIYIKRLAAIHEFTSPCADKLFMFSDRHPTACVTRGWAGRDNATLPEPAPSHANCLKTRRLPPVGCTLCWAQFADVNGSHILHNQSRCIVHLQRFERNLDTLAR